MKTGGYLKYVLDTHALFAYLNRESGFEKIEKIIKKAKCGRAKVLLNEINLGELYYKTWKENGKEAGKATLTWSLKLPLIFMPVDQNFILKAAEIKATNKVSYADAFCIQTAIDKNCPILTGDPEFAKIEGVKVIWIGK